MKNHELIEKVGGIEKAREIVAGAPTGATIISLATLQYFRRLVNPLYENVSDAFVSVRVTEDGFLEHNTRFAPIILPIELGDIRTAIAEHDAPEFKVGDLVVLRDSPQERVLKVQMFQDDFIRAFVGDSSEYSFGHKINFRHATQSEMAAGYRIDQSNTDDVADIKYHVSPLTKVSCHHRWINNDVLGGTEHHFICAYCSEKKTEAFGADHE